MADNVTTPLPSSTKFKTKETATNGHMPAHALFDTAEAEVLGLVTTSPAANTVLGRLKDLLSLIVLAAGTNIIGKVGIDQTTDGTTNLVRLGAETTKVIGTINVSAAQKITPEDQYSQYETVAASQTTQAIGATGATGDYLAGVLVFPQASGCGVVTIFDNSTQVGSFPGGGTTALPSLVPFMIPVGLVSVNGAWKITTGASVTVVAIGKFT